MADIAPVVNLPPGFHIEQGFPDHETLQEGFKYFQQAIAAENHASGEDFAQNTVPLLRYGDLPCGSERARDALRLFLERNYRREVDADTLVLSAGATHGLFWLVNLIFNGRQAPADVYLEEPTYFCAMRLFRDAGMRMNVIPTKFRIADTNKKNLNDASEQFTRHVDFEKLEEILKQRTDAEKSSNSSMYRGGMIYLIPEHHNPTGFLMPEHDRRQYLSLATKYDCLMVCDDVYQFLNFPLELFGNALLKADPKNNASIDALKMPQPVCLFGQANGDERDHVVSNASFSKLLAPGLRLGWMEAPRRVVQHILQSGVFYSGGCPNSATAGMLVTAITSPDGSSRQQFERHVKRYALKMGQRMEAIRQVLHERLHVRTQQNTSEVDEICQKIRWTKPAGGFFFCIILPPPPSSRLEPSFVEKALRPALIEAKVFVHHGAAFSAAPREAGKNKHDNEKSVSGRDKNKEESQDVDATFACSYMIRLSAAYIASHEEAREAAEILCKVLKQELEKAVAAAK